MERLLGLLENCSRPPCAFAPTPSVLAKISCARRAIFEVSDLETCEHNTPSGNYPWRHSINTTFKNSHLFMPWLTVSSHFLYKVRAARVAALARTRSICFHLTSCRKPDISHGNNPVYPTSLCAIRVLHACYPRPCRTGPLPLSPRAQRAHTRCKLRIHPPSQTALPELQTQPVRFKRSFPKLRRLLQHQCPQMQGRFARICATQPLRYNSQTTGTEFQLGTKPDLVGLFYVLDLRRMLRLHSARLEGSAVWRSLETAWNGRLDLVCQRQLSGACAF